LVSDHHRAAWNTFLVMHCLEDKEFESAFVRFLEENGHFEILQFVLVGTTVQKLKDNVQHSLLQEQTQRLFNRIMNMYIWWWRIIFELKVNSSLKDRVINLYMKKELFAPLTIFEETLFTCCSYWRMKKWIPFLSSKILRLG
jgi:hypothetical protein